MAQQLTSCDESLKKQEEVYFRGSMAWQLSSHSECLKNQKGTKYYLRGLMTDCDCLVAVSI